MGAVILVAALLAVVPVLAFAVVRMTSSPVLALAALAAVVPFGSTITFPGPPMLANLSSLLTAVAIAAYAGHLMLAPRPPLPAGREAAAWGLLVCLAALTTIWSIEPAHSLNGAIVLATLVVLYLLVSITPTSAAELRIFETAVVLSGAVVGLYALYLAATGELTGAVDQRFVAAIGGSETDEVADPNITAASLLLPFYVAAQGALRPDPAVQRALYAGTAMLTTATIFLTGSRGGLLALFAGLVILLWTSPHRTRSLTFLAAPVLAIALAASLAPAYVVERVSEDSRSSGRTDIWKIGLRSCPEECLVGAGWSTFPDVHEQGWLEDPESRGLQPRWEAHSIWVGLVVEAGVVGLALVLLALAYTWRLTRRMPLRSRGSPRAALVANLLAASLLATFAFKYFWLVLIYVVLVHNASRDTGTDASTVSPEERPALDEQPSVRP